MEATYKIPRPELLRENEPFTYLPRRVNSVAPELIEITLDEVLEKEATWFSEGSRQTRKLGLVYADEHSRFDNTKCRVAICTAVLLVLAGICLAGYFLYREVTHAPPVSTVLPTTHVAASTSSAYSTSTSDDMFTTDL